MKRKLKIFAVFFIIAGIMILTWLFFYTPLGRIVRCSECIGIIMNEEHTPLFSPYTDRWQIPSGLILELEIELSSYVENHKDEVGDRIASQLSQYRRNYFGLVSNGDRYVIIKAMHKSVMSFPFWCRFDSLMAGGGDSVWCIRYDVSTKEFSHFRINEPM